MTTPVNGNGRIRIAIADTHAIFRDGLRRLLEGERDFEVAGEASDYATALRMVQQLKPDILLLDLAMPRFSGTQALREIQARSAEVRTILLVAVIDKDDLIEALRLGARGLVLKDTPSAVLFKSIRAVRAGQYWLGRENVSYVIQALRDLRGPAGGNGNREAFGLTVRERQVIRAILGGYTNKDMAKEFRLSEQTIKHHLTKIFTKVGVSNRLELAFFASSHQLEGDDGKTEPAPAAAARGGHRNPESGMNGEMLRNRNSRVGDRSDF